MLKNKKATEAEKLKQIQEKFPFGFETITVKTTKEAKYHKPDETIEIGRAVGERMIKNGWAKKVAAMFLIMILSLSAFAQISSQSGNFYNSAYPTVASDTTTNTGTGILESPVISGGATSLTVELKIVKISGTVAGTVTLQGCVICDGNDWKAAQVPNAVTALATHTATDVATNYYYWWLSGSPYRQLRISHAGAGTMACRNSASFVKK